MVNSPCTLVRDHASNRVKTDLTVIAHLVVATSCSLQGLAKKKIQKKKENNGFEQALKLTVLAKKQHMKLKQLAEYFRGAIAVQVANQRGVRLIQLVLFCRVGGSLIWSSRESSSFVPKSVLAELFIGNTGKKKKEKKENVEIKKKVPTLKKKPESQM